MRVIRMVQMLIVLPFLFPVLALAQEIGNDALEVGFATIAAMAGLVLVIEELADKMWDLDGLASQIRTGVIGIGLGMAGAGFEIGLFETMSSGLPWYLQGGIVGLMSAFGGNFLFSTPLGKQILKMIRLKMAPKKQLKAKAKK